VPRILVIDPDRDRLAALQRALSDTGFIEVSAVPNASFALTTLERDRPDLVVSRARIPDIDGWELCSIIRSDPTMAGMLFLLLAEPEDEVAERPIDGGPDRMLVGDFTVPAIVSEVVSLLGPAEPPAPAATVPAEPAQVPEATGLRGALDVMDLPDLAQAIALGGKTGRLTLALPSGEGTLIFDRGRIVHAVYGALTGEAAFAALVVAAQRDAQSRFVFTPLERVGPDLPRTIKRSVEQLLLAAAAEIDEGRTGPAPVPRT
jgi:CheY-like chemotaxis protein